MSLDYPGLLRDLKHETDRLVENLGRLTSGDWDLATPAAGWSVKDQITHLAFFDDATLLALRNPYEFRVQADAHIADGMDFPDRLAAQYRSLSAETVLNWFTDSRHELLDAYAGDEPKRRLPWYGPEMSMASSATARLMETWAHAQDIYDALGLEHPLNPGLRSIAHLGVVTFGFSHKLHGREIPSEPVHIALDAPGGGQWTWGPHGAANRVSGPAESFVLVVTQRRHWTETDLVVEGPVAQSWLELAQAFAGAPSRRQPQGTP
ncbi:TIGR03084 family metal-binding protein [Mycolicibacterium pyrenivorans]|uniref:TIGR03084 family metal-binding protein n=1 Tax=Mycolicibacterium pyrenivorans TaxID=187102 RepID=UPI0021F38301|nr:TIGR03084 family metal-binding protein [Mycolicibacterium pyrenivorans]MCV7154902.1 TIGR03084 family protein [Mycolicibacterium pyrenivorans]